jgi:hypothetical protein
MSCNGMTFAGYVEPSVVHGRPGTASSRGGGSDRGWSDSGGGDGGGSC